MASKDPHHHTHQMQHRLRALKRHLREDIQAVDEPQLKAMF